jgi:regulator of protease activity HflC (stomatin/prohibitin superfamily)
MPLIEEVYWVLVLILVCFFVAGIRILAEYERGVMFRFGRFTGVKLPGFRWIIPGIDRMLKVSVWQMVMETPELGVTMRDKREATVRATVHFRVRDPERAVRGVENYLYATSQQVQDRTREIFRSANAPDVKRRMERLES